MPEATDDSLLESARAGDRQALEELLDRNQARVYRFGLQMCRNPEDAEDVLQETLLAMADGVSDFRGASSLSTWLYTIARSFCIKMRRRSKFAPAREESMDSERRTEVQQIEDSTRTPDELLENKQLGDALHQAIAALEPLYREVLILRDIEALTAPEVAEVLLTSVQAVKSRLHRARASVRETLAPLLTSEVDPAPEQTDCPDIVTVFSRHLEDEIDADVCAEMERHLAACPRCDGLCESLKDTLTLCRTEAPGEVPAPVRASVRRAVQEYLARSA